MTAGPPAKHSSGRAWWANPWLIGASVVVVAGGAGGAVAATGSAPDPAQKRAHLVAAAHAKQQQEQASQTALQNKLLAGLNVTPAGNATDVPLSTQVTVAAASGTIGSVRVTTASGAPLVGFMDPTSGKWMSAGALAPSTTYTVSVTLTDSGASATSSSTFTTVTPIAQITANVFPTNGMTVGVGQPVVIRFNHSITDPAVRTAIQNRFVVAESQPAPSGWYWFSPTELHLRSITYWPAHEQINVSGTLDGLDAGSGRWGSGDVVSTFSIGDARVAYANLQSETMRVTVNGATVATYPISGGRPQYPTMNGDHIVLDRESVVHMVSSTVGIPVASPNGYDEYVYDDVHISDSGEYVHAAPWSVGSQGVTNVSHGCINLSPANAQAYYALARVGDVVEVSGSARPPAYGDHGVMDFATPWDSWAPANVTQLGTPASTTTTVAADGSSTTVAATATTVAGGPSSTVSSTATTALSTTVAATTTTAAPSGAATTTPTH